MVYAMGKYVFLVGTTNDRGVEGEKRISVGPPHLTIKPAPLPAPVSSSSVSVTSVVRLAGHADVRWHLWIVLAAWGRLDAALVAYAAYYPIRAVAGAVRKAVRHA
jgi:hypothetical protein